MKKTPVVLMGLAVLCSASGSARAMDMDYVTYGGFDIISRAFGMIALVFSDNNYLYVAGAVFVAGTLIGLVVAVSSGMKSMTAVLGQAVIGLALFTGIIIPKGNILLYDPVKNKSAVIGGVPDGLVMVAGTLNAFETAVVQIIKTAGSPVPYDEQAGGIGLDLIGNLHAGGVLMADEYARDNLMSYTKECVFFEINRPGTLIPKKDITSNTDFVAVYGAANSPAIYAVWRDAAHSNGLTVTCQTAWDGGVDVYYGVTVPGLRAYLTTPSNFDKAFNVRCAQSGYDPTDMAQINRCKAMLGNLATWLQGAAYSATQVFQQTLIAHTFNDTLLYASPGTAAAALASRSSGNAMYSAGVVANSAMPVAMNVMTGVAIAMVPFFAIFIVSPLMGRALSLIAGLFIWVTAWHISDAIIHGFAMDLAYQAFAEARDYELGYYAVAGFGTASLKALGMMGYMRFGASAVATVISSQLFSFGSTVLAQLGSQATGAMQQGAQAGAGAMTAEGKSREIEQFRQSITTMANQARWDFDLDVDARKAEMFSRTQSGKEMLDSFGSPEAMGVALGHGDAMRKIERAGAAAMMDAGTAHKSGMYGGARERGMVAGAVPDVAAAAYEISKLSTARNLADARATEQMLAEGAKKGLWRDHESGLLALAAIGKFGEFGSAEAIRAVANRDHISDEEAARAMRWYAGTREGADLLTAGQAAMALYGGSSKSGEEAMGKYAKFTSAKNTLDAEAAANLGGGFRAGMQATFGVNPSTGKLANITGKSDSGIYEQKVLDPKNPAHRKELESIAAFMKASGDDNSASMLGDMMEQGRAVNMNVSRAADGVVSTVSFESGGKGSRFDSSEWSKTKTLGATESMTLDPKNADHWTTLTKIAREMETMGNLNAAAGLRDQMASGAGIVMSAQRTPDGKLASGEFRQGANITRYDAAEEKKQFGVQYSGVFQAAQEGKSGGFISNINVADDKVFAARSRQLAAAWANDVAQSMGKKGATVDTSSINASMDTGLPAIIASVSPVTAKIGGSVGKTSNLDETVNLWTTGLTNDFARWRNEAGKQGLDGAAANAYMQKKFEDSTREVVDKTKSVREAQYGANAPVDYAEVKSAPKIHKRGNPNQ